MPGQGKGTDAYRLNIPYGKNTGDGTSDANRRGCYDNDNVNYVTASVVPAVYHVLPIAVRTESWRFR